MANGSNLATPAIIDIIKAETKNMGKLSDYLKDYIVQLAKIAQSITDISDANTKKLLECIDENGQVNMKGAGQLQMIRLVQNMTKLIGALPQSINQLASIDLGWKTLFKVQKNLRNLPGILSGIVSMITSGFQQILDNGEIEQLVGLLVSKDMPEEGEFYEDGKLKVGKKAFKQAGVIDAILGVFQIIGQLQNLKMPNMIKLYIAGKMTAKSLKTFMGQVAKELKPLVESEDSKAIWEALGTAVETTQNLVTTLVEMENVLPTIAGSIKTFFRAKAFFRVVGFGDAKNPGMIGIIYNLSKDGRIKSLSDGGDISQMMQGLMDMASNLTEFSEKLGEFSKNWAKVLGAKKLLEKISNDDGKSPCLITLITNLCTVLADEITTFENGVKGMEEVNKFMQLLQDSFSNISKATVKKMSIVKDVLDPSKSITPVQNYLQVMDSVSADQIKEAIAKTQLIGELVLALDTLDVSVKASIRIGRIKRTMSKFAKCMQSISESIQEIENGGIDKQQVKSVQEIADALASIMKSFKVIAGSIFILGLLAIPMMLFLPLAKLAVTSILKFANKIADIIQQNNLSPAEEKKVKQVLGTLSLLLLAIVTFELAALVLGLAVAKFFKEMLLGVFVMVSGLLIIIGMLWIVSKFSKMLSKIAPHLLTLLKFIGIMLLAIVATAISIMVINEVADQIEWMKTFEFLGYMIMLLVVFGLLGFVAGKVAGVLATGMMIILGLVGLILLTVVAMLLIVMALKLIIEIDFNENDVEKVKQIMGNVAEAIFAMLEALFTPPETGEGGDQSFMSLFAGFLGQIVKIVFAAIFLFFAVFAIFCMLLLTGMLKLIGMIDLDKEAILQNIQTVISTANEVINAIFSAEADNERNTPDGLITKIVEFVLPELKPVLQMLLSVVFLAATLLAITLLLIIALELRLLMEINLDKGAIMERINIVMDTANGVISAIFGAEADDKRDTPDGLVTMLIGLILPELKPILQILLSVIFLAATLLAITLIMVIALELRALMEINLDKAVIEERVKTVIGTANTVITSIFGAEAENERESPDGLITKLVEFVLPELAPILSILLSVIFLAASLLAISLILIMATELKVLEAIDLDPAKVNEQVNAVVGAARSVISAVFGEHPDEPKAKEGLLTMLIGFVLPELKPILQMLMAVMFLAISLLAISIIVLISTELKLLEAISLDSKKVEKTVSTVLTTARNIISQIFGPDDEESKSTKHGFISTVISFFSPELAQILDAIMAVAFLAVAFFAMTLVNMIAAELLILQALVLDPTLIRTNVTTVINTAKMISDLLFYTEEGESTETSKGFILSVLDFFCPQLSSIFEALMSVMFLAVTYFAIMLIHNIAEELIYLQELFIDQALIEENIRAIIDTAKNISDWLFYTEEADSKETSKGFILSVLNLFAPNLVSIFEALMAVAFLAVSYFAIMMLTNLAGELQKIAGLKLDVAAVTKKCKEIIGAAKTVINTIVSDDDSQPKKAKGFLRKLLEMVLPSSLFDMIDALMAIGFLAVSKMAVGMMGELARNLTDIAKLPSMSGIGSKASKVAGAAEDVIHAVYNSSGSIWDILEDKEKAEFCEWYLGFLKGTVIAVGDMAAKLKKIQQVDPAIVEKTKASITKFMEIPQLIIDSMKMPDDVMHRVRVINSIYFAITRYKNIEDNICTNALNSAKDLVQIPVLIEENVKDPAGLGVKLKQLHEVYKILRMFGSIPNTTVEKHKETTRAYIQMLDKINRVDLDKLKTASNLFRSMANFSESINGNFEGLAQSLNDKIAPLLEELKKLLEEVPNSIEASAQSINRSVNRSIASQSRRLSNDEVVGQIKDEGDTPTPQKVAAKKKTFADQKSAITELVNMFTSGDAKVQIR